MHRIIVKSYKLNKILLKCLKFNFLNDIQNIELFISGKVLKIVISFYLSQYLRKYIQTQI